MSWLLIAIWAPLLWAFSNHVDKHLITKYGIGIGIRGLITFSALCSIFIVGVAYIQDHAVFAFSSFDTLKLFISGSIYTFAILYYIKALSHDEASIVTPVFQMIPVFAFILGAIFLGEYLTTAQIIGGLVIVFGAICISLDFKSFRFHKKAFFLMVFSSFLFAVYQLMFKSGADSNFWPAVFWQSLGSFSVGVLFLLLKNYRNDFKLIFAHHSYEIIWLSLVVEVLTMGGNLLVGKAVLIAPTVALVLLVEAFQPICVFFLGILFTLTIPTFTKEKIDRRTIIQKVISISIILIGSYILYF